MEDPNILVATIAQISATIVAIIGGFLVSKILTLIVERNALSDRLKDVNRDLITRTGFCDNIRKELLDMDGTDFIIDSIEDLIEKLDTITIRELMITNESTERTEEELRPYFEEAKLKIIQAIEFYETKFQEVEMINPNYKEFMKSVHYPQLNEMENIIYEKVFEFLIKQITPDTTPYSIFGIVESVSSLNIIRNQTESRRYENLLNNLKQAERECILLEGQRKELKNRYNSLGNTEGIFSGGIVFLYFSIVGILYPIFSLPISSNDFTITKKWTVILLFVSGFIAVGIYLYTLVRKATMNK